MRSSNTLIPYRSKLHWSFLFFIITRLVNIQARTTFVYNTMQNLRWEKHISAGILTGVLVVDCTISTNAHNSKNGKIQPNGEIKVEILNKAFLLTITISGHLFLQNNQEFAHTPSPSFCKSTSHSIALHWLAWALVSALLLVASHPIFHWQTATTLWQITNWNCC